MSILKCNQQDYYLRGENILEGQKSIFNENKKNGWILSETLGGKAKEFFWLIDNNLALHIKREFKNSVASNKIISKKI